MMKVRDDDVESGDAVEEVGDGAAPIERIIIDIKKRMEHLRL